MDYCNYHPLQPATFYCESCQVFNCDACVDEGEHGGDPICFNCSQTLLQLGSVNTATPFWRRLQESFRYPLNGNAATLLIGVTVLSAVAVYLPFGFLWVLILSGAFLKYCFSALESTARGTLIPPDITEAYSGGLALLLNLLVIIGAAVAAVIAALFMVGPQLAGLLGVLILAALPAIIITYGMTESLVEALNPLNQLRLISAVGLPYGLLLAFIMIMSASVGVINQLIGHDFSFIATTLQSLTGNYYTLVTFHIMGYMIFQYQGELGFAAREDFGEAKPPRSARDRLAAKIDIKLKDGDYNAVAALLREAVKQYPNDRDFHRQCFEFFYATERDLEAAGSRYLDYLLRSDQEHQVVMIYKRLLHLRPAFKPESAATRHRLAKACKERGDSLTCAKLINGLHREFPNYPQLSEAYELMASALEDLPQQAAQAEKCRALAAQLAKRRSTVKGPSASERMKQIAAEARGETGETQAPEQATAMPSIDFK